MHAILVHGWKGWPENAWFPWLRRELERRGWTTEALALPRPILPDRREWVRTIRSAITGSDTVLVGHSLGCLAILWALDEHDGPPVERVVCVSGFARPFVPIRQYREQWFPRDFDFQALKTKAKHWSVIHGSFDPLVPVNEGRWLAEHLGVPFTQTKRSGHLTQEERAFEVPEILDAVLSLLGCVIDAAALDG